MHSAHRPGILLAAHKEFAASSGKFQADSRAGGRTRIRSPAEEGWPELMRAVAYLPFAASYCATMSAGMRPRSLTSRSRSLAQLRISLFLASFALVLRPRAGRPPDLSRPETRLWR